jgi:DcmR-like sensory protein
MSASTPVHSVNFYDTDNALIDWLGGIVSSGLNLGNVVLIVVTQDHHVQLVYALEQNGVDVEGHLRQGRFIIRDVRQSLHRFMIRGMPHAAFFRSFVRSLLANIKQSAKEDQGLVMFGEMVSVLWDEGNHAAALEIERLGNDILNEEAFHLHCAYPRSLFSEDKTGFREVCEKHSHVIGETVPG